MKQDEKIKEQFISSASNLNVDEAFKFLDELLELEVPKENIIALLNISSDEVGTRFASGEYYLADLILFGQIYCDMLDKLNFFSVAENGQRKGRIMIGVVKNDIHSIGKDIVAGVLRTEGFDVIDLGVDVPAEVFVSSALKYRPDIIALCGLLSDSVYEMKHSMEELRKVNAPGFAKIIIGGGCVDQHICSMLRADNFFLKVADTVNYCKKILNDENIGNCR